MVMIKMMIRILLSPGTIVNLGRIVLALSCNSFIAIQRENLAQSMELVNSNIFFLFLFSNYLFHFSLFFSGDWELQQRPAQSDYVLAHRSPEGQVRQRLDADDWLVLDDLDDLCILLALCLCLELIPIE